MNLKFLQSAVTLERIITLKLLKNFTAHLMSLQEKDKVMDMTDITVNSDKVILKLNSLV